jgi:nucleoside-diphosphate-sugar epimerase
MKIIVAGASGFIGGRLCNFLADEGFEIIALCNNYVPEDSVWKNKMSEIIKVDITSADDFLSVAGLDADVIINLVSLDHLDSNGKPDKVAGVNILPTWNFLHHYSKRGLRKFIYLSTIHIYGNRLDGLIKEDSPAAPVNPYGLTHFLSEQIVGLFARTTDIECHNIRLSNGFGAPQFRENKCWDLVINNLCFSAWDNQNIVLNSDGKSFRDFINITDLLTGILQIINFSGSPEKKEVNTLNFSTKMTISMLDVAIQVREVYEMKYNKSTNIYINRNQLVDILPIESSANYIIDNSVFLELMGNNMLHDIRFGINEIFDFLDNTKKI